MNQSERMWRRHPWVLHLITRLPRDNTTFILAFTLVHTRSRSFTLVHRVHRRKLLFYAVSTVARQKEPKLVDSVTWASMMKLSPGSFRLGILTPAPNALLRSYEEVRRSLPSVDSAVNLDSFDWNLTKRFVSTQNLKTNLKSLGPTIQNSFA